jgi:metallo-beta-lactamase class B
MKADVVLTSHPEVADVLGREAKRKPGKANPFIDPSALSTIVTDAHEKFEESLKKALAAGPVPP